MSEERFDRIDGHMHVLHEDALGRIAAIPDNWSRSEAKLHRSLTELKETIGQRLDPLEAAVRHHSVEIARPKKRRG